MPGQPPTGQVLNKNLNPTFDPTTAPPEDADFYRGRPSSNHPGGFIVTYCDGHAEFMNEDITYRVFCQLMTTDGTKARDPRNVMGSVTTFRYPAQWYANPASPAYGAALKPITDADVNY
jgi:prepilin-type processing-associated H-X9-DG protein